MSLLLRMTEPDSIQRYERAAMARLRDGRLLRRSEREFWAIYTLGYVVELILKTAFFRLSGLRVSEDVRPTLKLARPWAKALQIRYEARNLHDLMFWWSLLVCERGILDRPYSKEFSRALSVRIVQVQKHWREDMRYYPSLVAGEEARRVAAAASWIVQHRADLWR